MLLENKKIAIIGAGPVGLTMARLLQQNGTDVTVYERDHHESARVSGGPLDLHQGTGQDALKKAGLLEKYYALAIPMGRTVADNKGHVLFSKKPAWERRHDNPEINRNDLRKILLDSLAVGTVVWDKKFTGLSQNCGKWLLHFENDEPASADLVIGANGGMSSARTYVTDERLEYTGTLILQGDVPHAETECEAFQKLCGDNILMATSEGNLLVANPRNGSLLSYSVTFRQPEDWNRKHELTSSDTKSIATFLLERFAGWAEPYKQLFRSTTSFAIWPTRKIPLNKAWKADRPLPITLIGDAAHMMPPFAGQGVNIGLMDALILSDNLTNGNFKTIETAINDYERRMFIYASAAQLETSRNETAMFRSDFSFQKRFESED